MPAWLAAHRRSIVTAIGIALAAGLVAVGVAARTAAASAGQPLSLDEAMLALNIATRDWLGLARPLALQQTAPIVFLWCSHLVAQIGGERETALRAVPYVAGLIAIPLTAVVAHDLIAPRATGVAAVLAALCPIGVQFGAIDKPYSVDVAVTVLLIALSLAVVREPLRMRAWWLAVNALAPFVSTPSVFVSASCLLAVWLATPAPAARHGTLAAAIVWLATAAINFVLFQRVATATTYLQHFWAPAFLRPPLGAMLRLVRARAGFMMQNVFTGYTVSYPAVWHWLLLAFAIAGVVHLARRRGAWTAVLLVGPVVGVGLAAALRLYPLADRTLLFLTPLAILGAVAAVQGVAAVNRPAALALTVAIVAPDAIDVLRTGFPTPDHRVQAVVATVWRRAQDGDAVYVFPLDVPRWAFYTTDWTHPDTTRVDRLIALATALGPNSGNAPPRGHLVARDADSLALRGPRATELIGDPTGMEILADSMTRRAPDSGWATTEAARVRAVARPAVWLVFIHGRSVAPALADTLRAAGGRITNYMGVRDGIIAYRYECSGAGTQSCEDVQRSVEDGRRDGRVEP
jgi:hypothetical protein